MKLSPGDQIQIILTTGGVPYAKTHTIGDDWVHRPLQDKAMVTVASIGNMLADLMDDIDLYGDDHEEI